jgi:MFS transporter, DHA1 family, multidrug resistance protein
LIGNFVVQATNWRWSQYLTIIFALAAFLFAVGMPETYGREIPRRRNRYRGLPPPHQPPAESGVTLAQMARITVISPLAMLVSEPLVIMCTIYLGLNFAVVFQWFITVPVVLSSVYKFTPQQVGLAFTSAIAGVLLAAVTSIMIELGMYRKFVMLKGLPMPRIEYRLIPAMIGGILQVVSLFWIGFTASPKFSWASPVLGTMVYVWGNALVLVCRLSNYISLNMKKLLISQGFDYTVHIRCISSSGYFVSPYSGSVFPSHLRWLSSTGHHSE